MNKAYQATLNKQQINAIINTDHDNIFSVLGMHSCPETNRLLVRVFLPGASHVDVIANKGNRKVASLSLIDQAGLFEGPMGRRRLHFDYHLIVTYDNQPISLQDPYRFSSMLDDEQLYLFNEGTQERLYQWMGAHISQQNGIGGTNFVVWAPDARCVSVIGDFNHWDGRRHMMRKHSASGLWEIFVPNLVESAHYKFKIRARDGEILPLKSDPLAQSMQGSPETACKTLVGQPYIWNDHQWMTRSSETSKQYDKAISIYEVHLGSWRRTHKSDSPHGDYLNYREIAEQLIPYVIEMGFTHLQLMPISEYPFDGSWGYQPIGLFAPTSRFGSPDDFKYFVDCCHQNGIGLLIDWVPGHFPTDEHGTGRFDGSCLYEHEDVRKGFHPDWNTLIYNYGRGEVISYLLSNAMYWLEEFHIDGLRVDAVASMLYLDYSRKEGEWLPNQHGGRENLEAVELLKQLNRRVYFNYPKSMMVAEESTSWPGVTKPTDDNGLGFGFKWNMGWMNDTLSYMQRDPIHRKHHHNEMTFGLVYSFSENFVLPLSHDEVVHGKGSLINKMPGDEWQKFANLRAYFGFMWTHPGKKLLFMGGEFAQRNEWNHDQSLDWHLLKQSSHSGIQQLIRDLNSIYKKLPALYQLDCDANGFEWIQMENNQQSIFIFLRKGFEGTAPVLVVVNMTPSLYPDYQLGLPIKGYFKECLNTDSERYGGSNQGNVGGVTSFAEEFNGHSCRMNLCIPPLSTMIFKWETE